VVSEEAKLKTETLRRQPVSELQKVNQKFDKRVREIINRVLVSSKHSDLLLHCKELKVEGDEMDDLQAQRVAEYEEDYLNI